MKIGRLAFREEGSLWVAYYAMPDTMDGALFLGSIRMVFVTGVRGAAKKQAFMGVMRDAVADIIEDNTGQRPVWKNPVVAPEHERGGNS